MFKHEFEYQIGDLVLKAGMHESRVMTINHVGFDKQGEIYIAEWFDDNGGHFTLWLRPVEMTKFGG